MIILNTNEQGKKIVIGFMMLMGIMFLIPFLVITRFEGFAFFTFIPLIMFGSFVLFVFSIVKLSNKNQTKSNPINYNERNDRHCTSCHEEIGVNHQFCPYCGVKQLEYVICDYCGEQNSKHDLMCKSCNGLLK